jgi:O-antigen ligase
MANKILGCLLSFVLLLVQLKLPARSSAEKAAINIVFSFFVIGVVLFVIFLNESSILFLKPESVPDDRQG